MDLGPSDEYAVPRAEWLEAVMAISQAVLSTALIMVPGLVHTVALCHLRGLWVVWVGDLAPGSQNYQSTSYRDAFGACFCCDPLALTGRERECLRQLVHIGLKLINVLLARCGTAPLVR